MVAGRLQEKNGFFYIVLSYTDSAGKRRQPWIATGLTVKGNKKRAEKMLAETRKDFTIPLPLVPVPRVTLPASRLSFFTKSSNE